MAIHLIDINHNDELDKIIQKCNRNFRLIASQTLKQNKIDNQDILDTVFDEIETEANDREINDDNLQSQIDTIVETTIPDAIDTAISSVYKYKGSVQDESELPSTNVEIGDVYNIEESSIYGPAGMNVAWNGVAWDALGGISSGDYNDLINKPVVVENGKVYIGDDYGSDSDMNHIVIIASGITQQNAFAFDRYDGLLVYALRILRDDVPQSDIYSGGVRIADRYGRQIGYLQAVQRTDGNEGIDFGTGRTVNGVEKYNSVSLFINDTGDPWVQLAYPLSWRNALGLGALATKDSAAIAIASVSGSAKNSSAITAGNASTSAGTFTIAISPASEYTPIAIKSISFSGTGNANLVVRRWNIASRTSVTIVAKNVGTADVAANAITCTVEVYCIHTTAT